MIETEARPARTATSTYLRVDVALTSGSETALLRVLSTLNRRRCKVKRAFFAGAASADSAFCDELDLLIEAPTFYADQVVHWLNALLDVRSATVLAKSNGGANGEHARPVIPGASEEP